MLSPSEACSCCIDLFLSKYLKLLYFNSYHTPFVKPLVWPSCYLSNEICRSRIICALITSIKTSWWTYLHLSYSFFESRTMVCGVKFVFKYIGKFLRVMDPSEHPSHFTAQSLSLGKSLISITNLFMISLYNQLKKLLWVYRFHESILPLL